MKKNDSVAIIILNWNSYNDTFACLKSLETLTYPNFHVFLVDNDSQDDSYRKLNIDFAGEKFNLDITFIQSGENKGFAGGNNVGLKKALSLGYNYFWLLNNDTIVHEDALTQLIKPMKKNNNIGIVGSKILYYKSNIIWFAGGKVNKFTGITEHIGIGEEDSGQHNNSSFVDYITGCSLLISKNVIEKVGLMNEDYFLYFEETDWNLKVNRCGFKILYNPESILWHKVSQSTLQGEKFKKNIFYYSIRNNIYFIKKFYNRITLINFISFTLIRIGKHLLSGRVLDALKYGFLGIKDGLSNNMGKLSERRE